MMNKNGTLHVIYRAIDFVRERWNYFIRDTWKANLQILDALKRKLHPTAFLVLPENERKIFVGKQWRSPFHRSGWGFAIDAITPLHHPKGILLDGCLDESFGWALKKRLSNNILPYKKPWVGFIHRPPNAPSWYPPDRSLSHMIELDIWKESLGQCQGIFCLSNYLRDWLQARIPVPICSLVHPTETPAMKFDPDLFLANPHKSVSQIGNSQRRLQSIFELDSGTFEKKLLATPAWKNLYNEEKRNAPSKTVKGTVKMMHYLSKRHYDILLSQNIAFVHLYDSSANNAIIECIVRNTPLLVNPLPAVQEYLGEGYPLYFESLEEAAEKLRSTELILQAHAYLKQLPKEQYGQEAFRSSFMNSTIYSQLPSILG